MELEDRIVVYEIIEPARSEHEAEYDLARVKSLFFVGKHALFDQVDDPVAHHLGVDPEMLLVRKVVQDRVGYLAYPQLKRRAVLD